MTEVVTNTMEKGVIVIGGHVQGLGIIRIFGRNGIRCYLLDSNSINIAKHSIYCSKFIEIDPEQEFTSFLIELNSKYNLNGWLLIPTDDNYVRILSQNKQLLEKYFRVSVDDWQVIEKCYNKRITYRIVQDMGIDMPITYFPNNLEEIKTLNVDFPCIIKPAIMHKLNSQIHQKVLVCKNREELITNYEKVLHYISADEVIIQEIIPGDSENQYSACFFYNRTEPFVSLLARRKRQYPMDFGKCTTFAETIFDESLLENAQLILNKINFWGLCEVEFKKDERDGKYKFLEINPRSWKWHSIANKSVSPFLISLYNFIYDGRPIFKNDWDKCCWKDLITDSFVTLILLTSFKFTTNKCQNIEFAVFDINDIKPLILEIIYSPYLFLSR
ncbi:hypothetical protein EO98_06530 [Methanosarcina sp. 2.H.T.1A.6]|uniref:carboxylate--amine ligase n=1 Tax=unclassified Methanosarcina TaxID=2644672 RepID=UPI000622A295|nr:MULTISPECIES: hypothetical protein [unclassified Methanosarcina]KKG18690.1 hypothetical protein EO94_18995 [Methanosarcina sp. 2.H.T.1A.3]KKG19546.1 hypothetical protein EO97_02830 [Methanosarcina sp. 2.H.T.1A.15]KKG21724.1 hypothetical protein EO98_06530 [Methanosarcina sp. 2.H.T.1A.6]KKG23719.1 hypothetical protein EO96_02780 [Methanosarcina sp. 2.H.T.1A.8]